MGSLSGDLIVTAQIARARRRQPFIDSSREESKMHDIIVVGGGAAGMTAALYAQRNGKSALVIEKNGFGGQITHSPKVENYPGTLQMSGNEFAEKMLDQILAQGAEIEFENVISVEDRGDVKIVRTEEGGVYEGSAVVLATGVKHRMREKRNLSETASLSARYATATSTPDGACAWPAAAIRRFRRRSCCPKSAARSSCCRIWTFSPVSRSCRKSCSQSLT